ncbi:nucleotidyltransferase (plasmid) [Bosea sp. F3-2]|nr:nucleotidyltransferase [Bosea sp. (in: a-proteobacteria)]MCP4736860.1 nucleotidyltransferase [Bosea sp. (in: a-proteobacteria)]QEL27266.1 nucleotidyltransferase [Bosea sp. F3-2]
MVDQAEIDDALGKAERIGRKLQKAYWGTDEGEQKLLIVGSWGKNTQVRPSHDIDIMAILPAEEFHRFDAYSTGKQSALLQDVKNVLAESYPQTDMRGDGQVVVIDFNSITVEVVPVFKRTDDTFLMPDTRSGGSWKVVDPLAQITRVETIDALASRNSRPLTRMMKLWMRERNVPIKSFLLELIVAEFMRTYVYKDKTLYWYDWFVRDFLQFLLTLRNGYVILPGTGEYIPLGDAWVSRAQTALAAALTACDHERDDMIVSAGIEWRKIFGDRIPLA